MALGFALLGLVLGFLCLFGVVEADQVEIPLNGNSWVLSGSSGRVKSLQATVPGQVHTTL